MVNEHLDVESHWSRHLFCFRWQHNRDRGENTEELEGQIGEHTKQREKKRREEKEVKKPVRGIERIREYVNFDIIL